MTAQENTTVQTSSVAGISIRLRILKVSFQADLRSDMDVAGISIRLRILKDQVGASRFSLSSVAGISIRLRILKEEWERV